MNKQFCLTWIDRAETQQFLDYDTENEVRDQILQLVSVDKVEQDRIMIFQRPGLSVEDFLARQFLPKEDPNETYCPDCRVPMKPTAMHGSHQPTHIYSCTDCPNIMFEYSSAENTVELVRYLSLDNPRETDDVISRLISRPSDDPADQEVELLRSGAYPCTLNGKYYDGGTVEFVVEIDGNNYYHNNIEDAMKDYVTRLAKYTKRQEVNNR